MNRIASTLGSVLRFVAYVLMLVGGFACLAICFGIVKEVFGSVVAFLSLVIFPVLLVVSPWYALFAWGNWFPLVLVYGLGIIVSTLFYLSARLTGEEI